LLIIFTLISHWLTLTDIIIILTLMTLAITIIIALILLAPLLIRHYYWAWLMPLLHYIISPHASYIIRYWHYYWY
jgi:hypothetical protein